MVPISPRSRLRQGRLASATSVSCMGRRCLESSYLLVLPRIQRSASSRFTGTRVERDITAKREYCCFSSTVGLCVFKGLVAAKLETLVRCSQTG